MKAKSTYNTLSNSTRNFLVRAYITITNFAGKLRAIINRSQLFVINHFFAMTKSLILPIAQDCSAIIGHTLPIIGHRLSIIGHRLSIIGHSLPIGGHSLLIGGNILPIGGKLLPIAIMR